MSGLEGREQRALCWRCWMEYLTIRRFLLSKITLPNLSAKQMRFEREFVAAGGMLVAGSDPTGDGGTVAGYADQREIELLVNAGFTPLEAHRNAKWRRGAWPKRSYRYDCKRQAGGLGRSHR